MLDPDYEPALGEPALLAAHGDPVLRGQAVQRRERRDVVGLGMQPADRIRPHHVVEEQASLLAPEAQRSSQLRVMGRAAGVDEPAHDALEHPVHEERVGHRRSPPARHGVAESPPRRPLPFDHAHGLWQDRRTMARALSALCQAGRRRQCLRTGVMLPTINNLCDVYV